MQEFNICVSDNSKSTENRKYREMEEHRMQKCVRCFCAQNRRIACENLKKEYVVKLNETGYNLRIV